MNYFTHTELACPCCHLALLKEGFRDELNKLREACGHALKVNSVCRCKKHNKAVGGKPASFHLIDGGDVTGSSGCCAADISTAGWDGAKKWRFVHLAMLNGWSIGMAKTFFHIDKRSDYVECGWPNPVVFSYA